MAQYRRGLKDEIKDELALRDDVRDFGALITAAHSIDNRLYERRQERKASNPVAHPRRKENVAAATRKPSKGKGKGKKKAKDLSQVECYGCHKKGHYKNKCPRQEQAAAVGCPTPEPLERGMYDVSTRGCDHDSLSWTACYDDQCQVHLSEKQDSGWYPRVPHHQVAVANSEAYASEDDEGWGPATDSEEGELVERSESSNSNTLSNIRELHQADIEVREELIKTYRERLSYAEERANHLSSALYKAEEYARSVSGEYPMNAMFESLTPEEKTLLAGRIGVLALVQQFEELFKSVARELATGDMGGLAVIEGIVARRIRETLQGEPCDMLELVHIKPPRGSKFLKDGGVLLPDGRLVPWAMRNRAREIANDIAKLPVHREEIPPSRFLLPAKPVELEAPGDEESKN